MEDRKNDLKRSFEVYFDGCYGFEPQPDVPNTYAMGVCKLEYEEQSDTLAVHLRRPGLLIGKAGKTINALTEHLGCNMKIVEVTKF